MKKSPCKIHGVPNGWPDEYQTLEITSEELHHLFGDLKKSLLKCSRSSKTSDSNERLKKIPEYAVASIFNESVNRYKDSALKPKFFEIIKLIGEEMTTVANAQRDLDIKLEELAAKLEVSDYATIQKKRKELAECCSGKKTEKSEEQAIKQRKETLSVLFDFDAQCGEYTMRMLECLKLQSNFFQQCFENLSKKVPQIESKIDGCLAKPYFQTPMLEHLRHTGREIPYVIETCVTALRDTGSLECSGIFRLGGSEPKVAVLLAELDTDGKAFLAESDFKTVSTALKRYIKSNKDPIVSPEFQKEWLAAMKQSTDSNRLELLKEALKKMPCENKAVLSYLVGLLQEVASKSEVNMMEPKNLAICLAPTVFLHTSANPTEVAEDVKHINDSFQFVLEHALEFFPRRASQRSIGN